MVRSTHERTRERGSARRDLLLSLGAFTLLFLFAVGALAAYTPGGLGRLLSPSGGRGEEEQGFSLAVAHTNDTWGYLDPCG
jgi:hypothetical protein